MERSRRGFFRLGEDPSPALPRYAGEGVPRPHRIQPVLDRLDPLVASPTVLTPQEIQDLVAFVRDGLLDPRARPEKLCKLVPKSLPSGRVVAEFEDCE